MHEFVSFNRLIFPSDQAKINGISSASFYGNGIFTTIAIYNKKPFLWEKHWLRLTENAKRIGIDFSEVSENYVKNALSELVDYNRVTDGRARLTFFDESAIEIWQTNSPKKTSLLIVTADFRSVSENLSLTISPYRINSSSPLVKVKSCNYLENLLALREANQRRFNEAVRLNEKDEIVSACMANIFWIKKDRIFTPSLDTGALPGTTRDFVFDNFKVFEKKADLEELKSADSIFLTSAGISAAKVKIFNDKKYLSSNILRKIEELFIKVRK